MEKSDQLFVVAPANTVDNLMTLLECMIRQAFVDTRHTLAVQVRQIQITTSPDPLGRISNIGFYVSNLKWPEQTRLQGTINWYQAATVCQTRPSFATAETLYMIYIRNYVYIYILWLGQFPLMFQGKIHHLVPQLNPTTASASHSTDGLQIRTWQLPRSDKKTLVFLVCMDSLPVLVQVHWGSLPVHSSSWSVQSWRVAESLWKATRKVLKCSTSCQRRWFWQAVSVVFAVFNQHPPTLEGHWSLVTPIQRFMRNWDAQSEWFVGMVQYVQEWDC